MLDTLRGSSITPVESDRFDDVDFRMIERPEPRPRRRRRGLAVAGGLLVAGALALGASALASPDEPTPPAATPSFAGQHHHHYRGGHGCHHGDGRFRGSDQDISLRY
jgi:hypothetical protein